LNILLIENESIFIRMGNFSCMILPFYEERERGRHYILPSIANNIIVCNAAKSGCKAIGFARAV